MDEIVCSRCALAFSVPDSMREAWIECPRCRQRIVYPGALRLPNRRIAFASVLGLVLIALGILSLLCGWIPAIDDRRRGTNVQLQAWIGVGTCLTAVISGLVLLVCNGRVNRQTARAASVVFAIMAGGALTGLAASIYLLAACWRVFR